MISPQHLNSVIRLVRQNKRHRNLKMLLVSTTDPIPMLTDASGVIRISKTCITVDTIVMAFLEGNTEEIKEQYSSLQLSERFYN